MSVLPMSYRPMVGVAGRLAWALHARFGSTLLSEQLSPRHGVPGRMYTLAPV